MRRFVRRVETGEVGQFAATGAGVEALAVALLGHLERRVDEHLEELAGPEAVADGAAGVAVGRDQRDDHDEPGIGHQPRDLADAAHVLGPVGR